MFPFLKQPVGLYLACSNNREEWMKMEYIMLIEMVDDIESTMQAVHSIDALKAGEAGDVV